MSDYRTRIDAVEKLRIMKSIYTYQQLEELLRIQTPVLARYISMKNLPTIERARKIIEIYNKLDLSKLVEVNIKIRKGTNVIDISSLLSNVTLLKTLASSITCNASVVLTMPVDGVPFATLVAEKLNAKLAYVKEKEEPGVTEFYQVEESFGPGIYKKRYYLPKHLISKKDTVFLVDDILRTGKTFEILIKIANKAGAKIVGGATLIAKKETAKKIGERLGKFIAFYFF
ncbi:MAG: phosphoribosyltransferase family protein [Candidatus Asgardarchaeia archaeon]